MLARRGFTLVELLVVIAIIGTLVGLLVPAVFAVRRSFNESSVKFEVQGLAQAIEAYRSKHGDYPPDGSNWQLLEAHIRKAFPNALNSEINLLKNSTISNDYTGRVMDPAEAMVFFLGGFSADSAKPFTGKGGPFIKTAAGYTANTQRENSFYEFNSSRLNYNDDVDGGATANDLLPVYASYGTNTPYVYFNSKTYQFVDQTNTVFFNYHRATKTGDLQAALYGVARPLLAATPPAAAASASQYYEASKTFQIISPGVDGFYGWMAPPSSGNLILFSSTGQGYEVSTTGLALSNDNRFRMMGLHGPKFQPMWDNSASCIDTPTFLSASVGQ